MRAFYVIGPIDGIIGKKTRTAVVAFQMVSGLPETSDLDAATVARLRALIGKAAA